MDTIVTLTLNPAIDISTTVENVVPERKLYCQAPLIEPGGGAVNVSRAIKKLGGESLLLYPAGGYTGQLLKDLLNKEGINHRPFSIGEPIRESFVVLEKSSGQQYRFGMPGPLLKKEEWELCLQELSQVAQNSKYLVISGSLPPGVPPNFCALAAKLGKEAGARVIVDVSGEPLRLALDEGVFLVKPNYREFRELAGESIIEEPVLKEQALKFIKAGNCEIMVISLGAAGALMVSADTVEHIRPPTVPIVSKVGAGDSMVAGIVLSLARGQSYKNSVIFGVAAGAAAVMTPGTELCRRVDTERLYAKMSSA